MFYQSHFPWSANQKLSLVHHHKTLNPAGFHSLTITLLSFDFEIVNEADVCMNGLWIPLAVLAAKNGLGIFSGQKLLETYYTKAGRHSKKTLTPCKAERQSLEQRERLMLSRIFSGVRLFCCACPKRPFPSFPSFLPLSSEIVPDFAEVFLPPRPRDVNRVGWIPNPAELRLRERSFAKVQSRSKTNSKKGGRIQESRFLNFMTWSGSTTPGHWAWTINLFE